MKRKVKAQIPDSKITYLFTQLADAKRYIDVLMKEHYVFTVLPYEDCTKIETYEAAPKPAFGE